MESWRTHSGARRTGTSGFRNTVSTIKRIEITINSGRFLPPTPYAKWLSYSSTRRAPRNCSKTLKLFKRMFTVFPNLPSWKHLHLLLTYRKSGSLRSGAAASTYGLLYLQCDSNTYKLFKIMPPVSTRYNTASLQVLLLSKHARRWQCF